MAKAGKAVTETVDEVTKTTAAVTETTENVTDEAGYFDELVEIFLMKDNAKYKDDLTVTVNGVNYQIKRGQTVLVPRKVALVVQRSMSQETKAAEMLENLVNAKEV